MNHPYLFLLTFESVKWGWKHCDFTELEQEEISLMFLNFLYKLLLNICYWYWVVVTVLILLCVALQNKYETLVGRVTLADVTKLPHFLPHAPQSLSCLRSLFMFSLSLWEWGQCQPTAWFVQGRVDRLVPRWAAAAAVEGTVIPAMSPWAPQQDRVAGALIAVVKAYL